MSKIIQKESLIHSKKTEKSFKEIKLIPLEVIKNNISQHGKLVKFL